MSGVPGCIVTRLPEHSFIKGSIGKDKSPIFPFQGVNEDVKPAVVRAEAAWRAFLAEKGCDTTQPRAINLTTRTRVGEHVVLKLNVPVNPLDDPWTVQWVEAVGFFSDSLAQVRAQLVSAIEAIDALEAPPEGGAL